VKRYTMSAAAASQHTPEHPERTARRSHTGALDFDVDFQVWPNRASMAHSIRMQEKSAPRSGNWHACTPLRETEGY
jgi:hypothetical protein